MWLYGCTIFLSAFLLFQIQPMVAKWMLPYFGGSAAVWTTCMLFFQSLLLLGCFYSDRLIRRLNPKAQAGVHFILLATSAIVLGMRPQTAASFFGDRHPVLGILALLAASVGAPYFVLSTTTPLIQAWYARGNKAALPYRLFALSKLSSILELLGYPVPVEPFLSLRHQFQAWAAAYALFVALLPASWI